MPSAAVFVSRQSLTDVDGACGKSSPMVTAAGARPQKNDHGMTSTIWLTSMAVILCSALPIGYNIGVMNAPQQILQTFCNDSIYAKYDVSLAAHRLHLLWASVVSAFLICGMIGSLAAGILCNKFGRRGALLRVNVIGLLAAILFFACKAAASVEMLLVARILAGFHAGCGSSIIPMYLTEIGPPRVRSMLGVFMTIGMSFGIVVSTVLGLETILGTEDGWPYLLSAFAVPVTVGSVMLFCSPESPKYLYIVKGRTEQALKELSRLREAPINQLDDDIVEMKKEAKNNLKAPAWSYSKLITSPSTRLPVVLICLLHVGNQMSGISAVFYYSTGIFYSAGLSRLESQYASIGATVANLIIAAMAIVFVNRFRRKKLYLTSAVLTIFCLAGLITSFVYMTAAPYVPYVSIGLLLLFVFTFGLGLGPIPFFIGSELFPHSQRPKGMSIGATVNWLMNFTVGATFPTIQDSLGDYTFAFFICCLVVITIILSKYMYETMGLTFHDDDDDDDDTPTATATATVTATEKTTAIQYNSVDMGVSAKVHAV